MKVFSSVNDPEIARILQEGGVGVLRTDTLYGVVACANDEAAVRRVYELKGRDDDKSPIVLVSGIDQLFDELSTQHAAYVKSVWPGPYSIIVPARNAPVWIRRGNGSVAYRMPDDEDLRSLIESTGPLIAPSANPQGMQPAMNLEQAKYYFAGDVDFYIDGGTVHDSTPSSIVRLDPDGKTTKLR